MKNNTRQVAASSPIPPSLSALQAERQARSQLHRLFLQQPELCVQVIRRWLDRTTPPAAPQTTVPSAAATAPTGKR